MKTVNIDKTIQKLEAEKTKATAALDRKIQKMKERQVQILNAAIETRKHQAAQLLLEAEGLKNGTILPSTTVRIPSRERALPRGILTMALVAALRGTKGQTVDEVVAKLQEQEQFKDIPNLPFMVRNSLNSNKNHFGSVKRGVYKAHGKLEGALFTRLKHEQQEVVAA